MAERSEAPGRTPGERTRRWSRGALVALAGCLVGCPASHRPSPQPEDVRVVPGELDANKLLGALGERAREVGAGALKAIGARVLSEGEQLGSFVEVPPKDCLLVVARGGTGVGDIDLFVYTDGGDRLASDEAPDARAAVLVCPPHPRRVYVVARSVGGEGVVALGVMRVPATAADAVAKAVEVRGRPGQDTGKLAEWPGLERTIRERRVSLGSRWEDVRRVAVPLSPEAHTSVTVEVERQRCVDILVVPSDEIQGLDAEVVDARGRSVARTNAPGRERGFVLCSREPEVVTLMLRPRVSSGLAAVIIGRSEPGAMAEIAHKTWVSAASSGVPLDEARGRHVQRTAPLRLSPAEVLFEGQAAPGAPHAEAVEIALGCTRLDVLGGSPLGGVVAELWADDGKMLGRGEGHERAPLFTCGPARRARLEVAVTALGGPFAVEARLEPKPAAALLQQPVAASRLLNRLEAAVGPIDVQHAGAARSVRISTAKQVTERFVLAPRKCSDVVAALGEGPSGLTLSLELAGQPARVSRGQVVTGQRICGGDEPQTAVARLGVGQGEGHALLLAFAPD